MSSPCLLALAGSFTTRCRCLQPPPDLVGAMRELEIATTWVVFVTAVVWLDKGWPDSYWADPNSSQTAEITKVIPNPYSLILKGWNNLIFSRYISLCSLVQYKTVEILLTRIGLKSPYILHLSGRTGRNILCFRITSRQQFCRRRCTTPILLSSDWLPISHACPHWLMQIILKTL